MLNVGILKKDQITEMYDKLITNFVCSVLGPNGKPSFVLDRSKSDISSHAGDEKRVEDDLCERSLQLVREGANLIIVPNNSMIKHADAIERETGAEVIIPAHGIALAAKDLSIKRLSLFSTKTVINSGLMSRVLVREGLDMVPLSEVEKEKTLDFVIRNVLMANDIKSYPWAKEQVEFLADRVSNPKSANPAAQGIALGCTELETKLPGLVIGVPVLGAIKCSALDASNELLASVTAQEANRKNMDLSNLLRLRDKNGSSRVLRYSSKRAA